MDKELVLAKIKEQGIVAVVRGKDEQDGVRIADACIAGGVKAIEVAFTTPRAHECIKTLVDKYQGDKDVIIGAGTVLDAESARMAIDAGATFIVSPNTRQSTIEMCNRYGVAAIPGTLTATEVLTAYELGGDLIKVFPCDNVGGPEYIKALRGPYNNIPMVPCGGVDIDDVADYMRFGAAAVGVGSSLMDRKLIAADDWRGIVDLARRFVDQVAVGREG